MPDGAVTRQPVRSVPPGARTAAEVAEVGRTVQPAGPVSDTETRRAGVRPRSVTVLVSVAGVAASSNGLPSRPSSTAGGRSAQCGSAETRSRTVPCAGTVAAMVPAVLYVRCCHRSLRT